MIFESKQFLTSTPYARDILKSIAYIAYSEDSANDDRQQRVTDFLLGMIDFGVEADKGSDTAVV